MYDHTYCKANNNAVSLLFSLTGIKVAAQKTGATVPWTTFEAEAGTTNGSLQNEGDRDRSKITYEASGRAAIELNAPGNYIAIKSNVKANRITIRYSVPKAPQVMSPY